MIMFLILSSLVSVSLTSNAPYLVSLFVALKPHRIALSIWVCCGDISIIASPLPLELLELSTRRVHYSEVPLLISNISFSVAICWSTEKSMMKSTRT